MQAAGDPALEIVLAQISPGRFRRIWRMSAVHFVNTILRKNGRSLGSVNTGSSVEYHCLTLRETMKPLAIERQGPIPQILRYAGGTTN